MKTAQQLVDTLLEDEKDPHIFKGECPDCFVTDENLASGKMYFAKARDHRHQSWQAVNRKGEAVGYLIRSKEVVQNEAARLNQEWEHREDLQHLITYEEVLADPYLALKYAKELSKEGQFVPEAVEKALANNAETAYRYAALVHHRFPLGEPAIAKDPYYARAYDQYFLTRKTKA